MPISKGSSRNYKPSWNTTLKITRFKLSKFSENLDSGKESCKISPQINIKIGVQAFPWNWQKYAIFGQFSPKAFSLLFWQFFAGCWSSWNFSKNPKMNFTGKIFCKRKSWNLFDSSFRRLMAAVYPKTFFGPISDTRWRSALLLSPESQKEWMALLGRPHQAFALQRFPPGRLGR